MGADWPKCRIVDAAKRVAMGPFGSAIKVETFVPTGVPVISGQHLHGSRVDGSVGFNYVTEEHADRLKNANVQPGDVVFTHAGNIGQVAMVPRNSTYERYVISQRQFYVRCDESRVLPEYFVAYFKTPAGQHQLLANRTQVGVPSIAQPVSYLRTVEIPIPPIRDQLEITRILGALDDKIDLNRRMNATVEAMAQALFKSWFVDFDPVLSKAESRETRLSQRIVRLFPSALGVAELGETPKGWPIGRFGDLVELLRDTVDPRLRPNDRFSHYSIPAFDSAQEPVLENGSGIRSQKWRVPRGTVLLSKLNPDIERVWLADVAPGEHAISSTEFMVLRPRNPFSRAYVYCLARSDAFRRAVEGIVTGTSGSHQRASATAILDLAVLVPSPQVVAAFAQQADGLLTRTLVGRRESRALKALREALLPKLVSGELRAPVSERMLGAAPA